VLPIAKSTSKSTVSYITTSRPSDLIHPHNLHFPLATTTCPAMVLDSALENDPFPSSSEDAYSSPRHYPPPPPVPSFLGFRTGMYSDAAKDRYINLQFNIIAREFDFHPTPLEREGLAYYNAIFYVSEAKGSLYGTVIGGALAALMVSRQKKAGFPFRTLGNRLGLHPKNQLLMSRATNLVFIATVGRLYGITSAGVSSFNQVRQMQKEDPNMQRYIAMRTSWFERRRHDPNPRPVVRGREDLKRMTEGSDEQSREGSDPQSLGGLDFYDEKSREDEAGRLGASVERGAPQQQQSREYQRGYQQSRVETAVEKDEDPFFGQAEATPQPQPQPTGWTNTQANGSAWERLRQREKPAGYSSMPDEENYDKTSSSGNSWPRRPPMKGFETSQEIPRRDTFSFSNAERERVLAKEDAQKEFDERVQRERRGEGTDGFASDVGQTRRR
jgi:hypothetical protein